MYGIKKIWIFFILQVSIILCAAGQTDIFQDANLALQKKEYEKALTLYKKVELLHKSGFGLNKNMAICFAGLQDYPQAILYLEKALKHRPNDQDTHTFLQSLKSKASVDEDPETNNFLSRLAQRCFAFFCPDTWAAITLFSCFLTGLYIFLKYPFTSGRKTTVHTGITLIACIIIPVFAAWYTSGQIYKNNAAIVIKENTGLRMGPDDDSPEISNLPPGTKVYYKDHLDQWWQVKTTYGEWGWIPALAAARI